ncbi:nucleoside 2-deoxyribosyltransferase, partial [Zavarzinia sp.]|uniref:nucleoside 2-deoxyribosyltransferase n=1 Tax=Zavarzinia sp. TaxID=2027920 RepID=UPI00356457EB
LAKQEICAARGVAGLYPLDGTLPQDLAPGDLARAICAANIALIRRADAVIANLTPFRAPGADAGTVFEVGFALALGKPVIGYRNTTLPYADRVRQWNGGTLAADGAGTLRDRDGLMVEDFGLGDNLMIDGSIEVIERASAAPLTDLAGFEAALRRLLHTLEVPFAH